MRRLGGQPGGIGGACCFVSSSSEEESRLLRSGYARLLFSAAAANRRRIATRIIQVQGVSKYLLNTKESLTGKVEAKQLLTNFTNDTTKQNFIVFFLIEVLFFAVFVDNVIFLPVRVRQATPYSGFVRVLRISRGNNLALTTVLLYAFAATLSA